MAQSETRVERVARLFTESCDAIEVSLGDDTIILEQKTDIIVFPRAAVRQFVKAVEEVAEQ